MGKLDDLLSAVGRAAPESKYIRAYHGSPHDFDRFDASKIGTGEGVQAFGHGLYFAGNEAVADSYRQMRSLSAWTPEEFAANWWRTNSGIHASNAAMAKAVTVRDIEEAMKSALSGIPFPKETPPEFMQQGLEFLRSAGDTPPPPVRRGRMYEVELGVPEDALLDLDSPVVEQPRAIQDMLGSYGRAPSHFTFGQEGWRGSNALSRAQDNLGGSARDASRVLLERGIPGVRYFDGNSRRAAEGTRNYVMFPGTEDSIRILRKYGLLPPMAAAAGGAASEPQAEVR
jgi:hypothetical protein